MTLIFTETFYDYFPSIFASGTELCHVKFGNKAISPKEVARYAVYTCCRVKGCNIVYKYLNATAANYAHLTTKFTLYRQLGG